MKSRLEAAGAEASCDKWVTPLEGPAAVTGPHSADGPPGRDLLKTSGGLTEKGRTIQLKSRKKPKEMSLASGVLPGPSASSGTQLGEPLCASERQGDKNQSPRLT